MDEFLGLGLTHYPPLATTDQHMADLLRGILRDPGIPGELKDPAHWPDAMREEWADDGGTAAAAEHRRRLMAGLTAARKKLDDFEPDVLIVWGDDQYENFREEVVPPFCVLALEDCEVRPFAALDHLGMPNVWGLPPDATFSLRGAPGPARELVAGLIEQGVDMAYSYRLRPGIELPHAFANTQLFLDYDNVGRRFPYPIIPISVNCYGQHVIARGGGRSSFAEIAAGEALDPPAPTPARCLEVGRAVARAAGERFGRVALVASSSWSHAFLNDKAWHLHPDIPADRRLYDAMVAGDLTVWRDTAGSEVVAAGQQEMLNWFCLLGAVEELGLRLTSSSFVETWVLNSNKVFATFERS